MIIKSTYDESDLLECDKCSKLEIVESYHDPYEYAVEIGWAINVEDGMVVCAKCWKGEIS